MRPISRKPREARSLRKETPRGESSLRRKALSLAFFLILASSLLNALFGDRGFTEMLEARQELEALEGDVAELQRDNQRYLEEIRNLKTSPLIIERLAREQLGLVKPNEIILLIRKPNEK